MNENFTLLPWGVVTDFLDLGDVLNGRAVCRDWQQGMENGISMDWCKKYLTSALKRRNCFLVPPSGRSALDGSWETQATQEKLRGLFLTPKVANCELPKMTEKNHWKQFLLSSRVMKNIPQSLTVAFSKEDGRHCIPMGPDEADRCVEKCCRTNCTSCLLRPKMIKDLTTNEASINKNSTLNARYGEIDMSENLAKCLDNLPARIICPNCHADDKRSLVLGDFSYKSTPDYSTLRLLHDVLTFTPCHEPARATAGSNNIENVPYHANMTTRNPRPPKKPRLSIGADVPFPPRYVEMALPTREEPIPLPADAKFGISIHCTACRDFAIVAPAAVCWHSDFVCQKRGQVTYQDGKEITLGGVLVRSRCSAPDCQKATSCPDCSHRNWHDPYSRTGGTCQVRRSSHCDTCQETYCSEHAWLSTMCHHW